MATNILMIMALLFKEKMDLFGMEAIMDTTLL
jgi:hypothetical protein